MAKDMVRLTPEARTQVTELRAPGRRAASVLRRARRLLKAAARAEGPAWSDRERAAAVAPSLTRVPRVRQVFGEDGFAAALARQRPTGWP